MESFPSDSKETEAAMNERINGYLFSFAGGRVGAGRRVRDLYPADQQRPRPVHRRRQGFDAVQGRRRGHLHLASH